MLAEVGSRTMDVFTVKVVLMAPAGIVTLEGTLAAALLLASVIRAPPTGAGLLSATVPEEDCKAPRTIEGFTESEARVARAPPTLTISVPLLSTPLSAARLTS